MNGHHLILGQLQDCITGEALDDTHDERYRQKIARLLMERKGYAPAMLSPRFELAVEVDGRRARLTVTLIAWVGRRMAMLMQYGPGSLTTRHRPALALGRLAAPYQIPVVVVTNGEQADILDGLSGHCTASGLDNLPSCAALTRLAGRSAWPSIDARRKDMESRIVFAFEVDDRCPCDDTVCRVTRQT